MADLSQSVCLNHPNTPAVARCATCGKPICSQCIVSRNGSSYCSAKCADSAASSDGRVKDVLAEKKRTNAKGTVVSTELGTVYVTLDSTSTWTLTGDSYVTEFNGDAANVISNGYTLYVNGAALSGTN